MKRLTASDLEAWGISELIEHIQELTYLLDDAEELLEPYADQEYVNKWIERKESYVGT